MADPIITTQPIDQTVDDGDPYTFTVVAEAGIAIVDDRWDDVDLLVLGEDGNVDASSTARTMETFGAGVTSVTQAGSYGATVLEFATNGAITTPAVTLGTAFSVEWRAMRDTTSGNQYMFDLRGAFNITVYVNTLGWLYLQTTSGTDQPSNVGGITLGAWHDFQLSYDGTTIRLFVDGVQQRSVASASTNIASERVNFGGYYIGTTSYFDGKMENIRISLNGARNVGAYTPEVGLFPTQGPVDDNFADVWVLHQFKTDLDSDILPVTTEITQSNSPAYSASAGAFGGGAADMTGGTMRSFYYSEGASGISPDLTGDLTVEFFYKPNTLPSTAVFDFLWEVSNGIDEPTVAFLFNGSIYWRDASNAELVTPTAYGMTPGVECFLQFIKTGTTYEIWKDGVLLAGDASSSSNLSAPAGYAFRVATNRASAHNADGYFSEIRVTEAARTDHTVPTAPFPTQGPAALTYQWEEETSPGVWEALVGETVNVYTDTAVIADDGRVFRCAVTQGVA
jgi:hypothetical protein